MTRCGAILLIAVCGIAHAERPSVGSKAPNFSAQGVDGQTYTRDSFKKAKAVVVCFLSSECPVSAVYEQRLNAFAKAYGPKGVRLIALNASDPMDHMRIHGKQLDFVYAQDKGGPGANAFGARLTPEVFVLNAKRRVVFHGAFDNSQRRPTEHFVRDAVEAILAGQPIKITHAKPFGCSLKIAKTSPAR